MKNSGLDDLFLKYTGHVLKLIYIHLIYVTKVSFQRNALLWNKILQVKWAETILFIK